MSGNIDSTSEDFLSKQQEIYKSAYVTLALIVINIIVFVISNLVPSLYSNGAMFTAGILANGEYYRIFTATFLHANVKHLFDNMIMLGIVGAIIENYMGHGLYLIMYLLAGICGNLLSMAYEIHNDLQSVPYNVHSD